MARFCLTNTIDNFTSIGKKYYHNISQGPQNQIKMRPRIPLRYDFNDVKLIRIDPQSQKARLWKNAYRMTDASNLYELKPKPVNALNTLLLYTMSFFLIFTSIKNMKKILKNMQEDETLNKKTKMLFRLSFVFSFLIVLFVSCFLALSLFELFRNQYRFGPLSNDGFQYKDMRVADGNRFYVRFMVMLIMFITILLCFAEIINLFYMRPNKNAILLLFIPVVLCLVMFVHLYVSYAPAAPRQ